MSKDLGVVQGDATRWVSDVQTTIDNELIYACSFFGGKERGACVQLTIAPNNYIELTRTGVKDLAEILVAWLEDHPELKPT